MERRSLRSIGDDELLARLAELLRQSRRVESDLVAHIAEVDERKLYAREASPSMFAYCTDVLHLSEAEAYLRIAAARACRAASAAPGDAGGRSSSSLRRREAGATPHSRQCSLLLARAEHKTKREIEELIAEVAPRPDAPTALRKLPQRSASAPSGGSDAPGSRLGPCAGSLGPCAGQRRAASSTWQPVRSGSSRALGRTRSSPRTSPRSSPSPSPLHKPRQGRLNCVQTQLGPFVHGPPRSSSLWRSGDTRSSSRPAPASRPSWSGCGPSCARRCRTATSAP